MRYSEQRQWSDRFIAKIKQIVGPALIEIADFDTDTKRAGDLIILSGRHSTIACRVRRYSYLVNYPNQFTMRSRVKSNSETELQKITNGWGDLMFYGFATEDEKDIHSWRLIDLTSWRAHMIRNNKVIKKGEVPNGDGTFLAWFDVNSFPLKPRLIVAEDINLNRKAA